MHMMNGEEDNALVTESRAIIIENDHFTFGNVEAWISIIASYNLEHPDHIVTIFYDEMPVYNLISLYKRIGNLDTTKFEVQVAMPDRDKKNVNKLRALLREGAGKDFHPFITKARHRVLKLF